MVALVKFFDGKKFMWDGLEYPDKAAASGKAGEYANANFEAKLFEEGGKHYVFTRRVAVAPPPTQ